MAKNWKIDLLVRKTVKKYTPAIKAAETVT